MGSFVVLRRQIGRSNAPMVDDAVAISVAMYRTLRTYVGDTEALEIVEAEIVSTGTEMMQGWIPTNRTMSALGDQVAIIMGDAESRDIYEIEGMEAGDSSISWDVTACRYAALTRMLGSPEVGRVFCAVDGPFVEQALPEIDFSCSTTIARGDDRCQFRVGDAVAVQLSPRTEPT